MKKKYNIGVRVEINKNLTVDKAGVEITSHGGAIEDAARDGSLFGIRTDNGRYFAIKGDDLTIIKN